MPALALDTSRRRRTPSPRSKNRSSASSARGDTTSRRRSAAAGYRIDIGVCHPDHPGVYALGVECDGSQYHSSRVARDRDRLREKVLRGLGWKLHRIWGTAWYRDRTAQNRTLRSAIEEAIAAPVHGLLARRPAGGRRTIARSS